MSTLNEFAKSNKSRAGYQAWREKEENVEAWSEALEGFKSGLPVAVNSGLYWPKHTIFMKRGHIIIDIQECVETNLNKDEVFNKVVETIETATNKIIS